MLSRNSLLSILEEHKSGHQWLERRVDEEDTTRSWLPIFSIGEHQYGLLDSGDWISEYSDRLRVSKPSLLVPFLVILERSRNEFLSLLEESINNNGLPGIVKFTFPLDELLECALSSPSDYWKRLAISWLESGYPLNDTLSALIPDSQVAIKWHKERIERAFSTSFRASQGDLYPRISIDIRDALIRSGENVIFHIRADWNGYDFKCEERLMAVDKSEFEPFVVAALDFDDERHWPFFKELSIRTIPALLFYKGGALQEHQVGLGDVEYYTNLLKEQFGIKQGYEQG